VNRARLSRLLYPQLTLRQFLWLGLFGLCGALIAGVYGVLHDLVTYSIGPEYFTRFKFAQFFYLDFHQPPRLLAAKIGFLASAWVGFFAAWFMGRMTLPRMTPGAAARLCGKGVLMMLVVTFFAGVTAGVLAPEAEDPRSENWRGMTAMFHVQDTAAFVRAGWIHNGSYLGAFLGLLAALAWLRKRRANPRGA